MERDNYRCKCGCKRCKVSFYDSVHHLINNKQLYRKIYGNLLQSKSNGVLLCLVCHSGCVAKFKGIRNEVKAVFDMMIQENPNIIFADQLEIDIQLNKYKRTA